MYRYMYNNGELVRIIKQISPEDVLLVNEQILAFRFDTFLEGK